MTDELHEATAFEAAVAAHDLAGARQCVLAIGEGFFIDHVVASITESERPDL